MNDKSTTAGGSDPFGDDPIDREVDGPASIPEFEDPKVEVAQLIDQAVAKAQEAGMTTSDLLGILHYYAHCVAASYRDIAMRESGAASSEATDDPGGSPLV